jgi:preprotein translocase subunit SecE
MNIKVEPTKSASAGDIVKYALAIAFIAAGVFAFYWFGDLPVAVRVLAVVGGLAVALVAFLATAKGGQTREFLAESRFELRKVVWPTRQEAGRATVMIVIAVIVLSLILAGFDVVIQAAVKFILGR